MSDQTQGISNRESAREEAEERRDHPLRHQTLRPANRMRPAVRAKSRCPITGTGRRLTRRVADRSRRRKPNQSTPIAATLRHTRSQAPTGESLRQAVGRHQSPLTLTNCFRTYFTSTRSLRVLHHLVDVLVGARDLVEQHLRVPVLDALHRPAQVVHAEERSRLGPRIAPAGAVRRGVKAHRMFLADDDVAARAHRAGNHRPVGLARLDRALAGDPDACCRSAAPAA